MLKLLTTNKTVF